MLRAAAGVISLLAATLFAFAFYDRYWLWRDCFNELGRCYDSATEQVYLEQAGVAWGSLTVICVFAAIFLLIPRKAARDG